MPYYPPQMRVLSTEEKKRFLDTRFDRGTADLNKYYPRLSYQFVPHGSSLFGENWGIKIPSNTREGELAAHRPSPSPRRPVAPTGRTKPLGASHFMSPRTGTRGFGKGKLEYDHGSTSESISIGDEGLDVDIGSGSSHRSPIVPPLIGPGMVAPPMFSPYQSPPPPSPRYMQLTGSRQQGLSASQLATTVAAGHATAPQSRRRSPPPKKKNSPRNSRNPKPNYGNFKRRK